MKEIVRNGLLLGVTILHDELVRGLLLVASLLTLRVAPGAEKVLTTTTGLGTTFTTTVRMVDRVHTHTADGRAGALPTGAASLGADDIHVLDIADLADRGVASGKDFANFT